MKLAKPILAELIGTFILVFIGVSAINNAAANGLVGIALAFGLAVAAVVSATIHISGGQINPAVTIALLATKKLKPVEAIAYILAQLIGATLASFACKAFFDTGLDPIWKLAGVTALATHISPLEGFLIEFILTFILLFVVFGSAVDVRGQRLGGLAIGLAVTIDILAAGPLTGASMNPARSFGPALAAGQWAHQWLFWLAPILGAVAAAVLYNTFF